MATFVLVHGAFHGGWCWKNVTHLLRAVDHEVFTPTLTGLGERTHLLTSSVTLSTHVQDIVNVAFYEDLNDIILVGHSYAGIVITGVAEVIPERIRRLVYLDAVIPDDGETGLDKYPLVRERLLTDTVEVNGTRTYLPDFPSWLTHNGITDPGDIMWMEPRLRPHPLATVEEPVRLSSNAATEIPRSFISCLMNQSLSVVESAEKARARGWAVEVLQTGHEAMITAPGELSALLLQIAETD